MKKYIFSIVLFFFSVNAFAQSVTFVELSDLLILSPKQVYDILTSGKRYKLISNDVVNGQSVQRYQSPPTALKGEFILTGGNEVSQKGVALQIVSYGTQEQQYMLNLIKQMERFNYKLSFKGADADRKIFIYENAYSSVTVYLNLNSPASNMDIRQKETD